MRLLAILFLFLSLGAFSQKNEFFRIDSLPKEGILLDKAWKWHAGDNPDFAKADFDDSAWESIDPTKDIFDLPQIPKNGKIFWLHLHLSLDNSIENALGLMIQQSGASEIYVNGQLIHAFGNISKNPTLVKSLNPQNKPIAFQFNKEPDQIMSIRYALEPNTSYGTHFGMTNSLLTIRLNTAENTLDNYLKKQRNQYRKKNVDVGVFGILTSLFFALYLFFPKRKVNLYFSIYTFLMTIVWWYWVETSLPNQPQKIYEINNLALAIMVVAYSFKLTSVYVILEQKRGWIYWFLIVFGFFCIPTSAFIYGWGWFFFGFVFSNLINIDITRIAFIAFQKEKKGAWIVLLGGIIFLIGWILFSFEFSNFYHFNLGIDLFELSELSIPVTFAIFVAYDSALANRTLENKLVEVENLSIEKQQILATQNEILEKQVTARTAELIASQNQLIQKEKLASLGELTAGIAHEIQNPLNFVNNFSEVSIELLEDLKVERQKSEGKRDLAFEEELLSDLSQNQEKINLHGKRASSIVKGMLEHSRTSTGEKELTDINALADEYLRLAYHGLRAKDSTFKSDYKTDFDKNLPKIEVIPQDIGRVLLNLINNAFWAVNERSKKGDLGYEPKVTVSTQLTSNSQVLIAIKDNGSGMTEEVKAKIFQPFFTTKPTGQGTGLGLSLAYDIVTKGHGGTLEVESKEGVGTEFIIRINM